MKLPDELLTILEACKLPAWARWAAQDQDGNWWVYQAEPLMHHCGWYENEVGLYQHIGTGTYNSAWQQQLYKLETSPKSDKI